MGSAEGAALEDLVELEGWRRPWVAAARGGECVDERGAPGAVAVVTAGSSNLRRGLAGEPVRPPAATAARGSGAAVGLLGVVSNARGG